MLPPLTRVSLLAPVKSPRRDNKRCNLWLKGLGQDFLLYIERYEAAWKREPQARPIAGVRWILRPRRAQLFREACRKRVSAAELDVEIGDDGPNNHPRRRRLRADARFVFHRQCEIL